MVMKRLLAILFLIVIGLLPAFDVANAAPTTATQTVVKQPGRNVIVAHRRKHRRHRRHHRRHLRRRLRRRITLNKAA